MCRSIRTLHNFEPPASEEEIRAAALQFVRKVSGSTKPSLANATSFAQAVDAIESVVTTLLNQLVTTAPPKNRDAEKAKAKAKSVKRFG